MYPIDQPKPLKPEPLLILTKRNRNEQSLTDCPFLAVHNTNLSELNCFCCGSKQSALY